MEIEQYMDRVLDQLKWYEHKAMAARQRQVMLDFLNTLFLAATPAVLMMSYMFLNSRAGVLAAMITSMCAWFTTTFIKISRYDSKWQQYRLTAEQIRKELTMFSMKAGEYGKIEDVKKQQDMFISRIENLVSSENSLWWVGERREDKHDAS